MSISGKALEYSIMIDNNYFSFYWENPLKTYKKIKKYFRPLKMRGRLTMLKGREPKILSVNAFDLMWKDKWNTPRHEYNPRIEISLFNYFHWRIDFTLGDDSMDDMVYWESALNWLYYKKPLHRAIKSSTGWSSYNKETDKYEPMVFNILKEPWQTMYNNKELPKLYYESTTR